MAAIIHAQHGWLQPPVSAISETMTGVSAATSNITNGSASGSNVVPRGTASPRGSLEVQFSLPRPRTLVPWPWSRVICLGLVGASRH